MIHCGIERMKDKTAAFSQFGRAKMDSPLFPAFLHEKTDHSVNRFYAISFSDI